MKGLVGKFAFLLLAMAVMIVAVLPFFAPTIILKHDYDYELSMIRAVSSSEEAKTIPLIVGGTDGSGTRSVVCLLDALGVPMVVDNERTLDAEAKEVGNIDVKDPAEAKGWRTIRGWPAVVRPVLGQTRSADFDPSQLPGNLRATVQRRLLRFWAAMTRRGVASRRHMGERASKAVSWGFKAPVSMLILPLLFELDGANEIRFLHVVRDGRDIAFSGNQSPITKFYNVTFPPDEDGGEHWNQYKDTPEVRGIELWSLWNVQILEWERRTANHTESQRKKFRYMVLRVENLVTAGLEARHSIIREIANFVGSQISDAEICCLANKEQQSLGSHTKENRNTPVESRFGKWKERANAETIVLLDRVGKSGLNAFGYDPYERDSYQALSPSGNTACDVNICQSFEKKGNSGIYTSLCRGNKDTNQNRNEMLDVINRGGPSEEFRERMRQRARHARRKRRPSLT